MLSIGVDIGGTFTDLVAHDESGKLWHSKTLTTPEDQSKGIMECIVKAGVSLAEVELILHGSTVAINTVIERKGAKTALVTTKGFRDVYEIGRGNRHEGYNLNFQRPRPLIPRHLRYEVTERVNSSGQEIAPLEEMEIQELIQKLKAQNIASVAICLLHSYVNSTHEKSVGNLIQSGYPEAYITLSHETMREFREFERTSTTALNAYVGPIVVRYINNLVTKLREDGFNGNLLLMQSNGGAMSEQAAKKLPVSMMESGPVAGVTGAAKVGLALGYQNVISFDMGGTTAKTSLIKDGKPAYTTAYYIGGYASGQPMMLPVVDIVEVGAGGGSMAWIDGAGSLKVGPESAGADPGPVCYGKGGVRPAVTDANVVLGRIGANSFLGGEMTVDVEKAREAIRTTIAEPLGLTLEQAAYGILQIVDAKMSLALRAVSIERGHDPRDFALVVSGGAGPVHAVSLARELSVPTVIIPQFPGQFSALGMLMSDLQHDYVQTYYSLLSAASEDQINGLFKQLAGEGIDTLLKEGARLDQVEIQRFLDLRYVGQEFTISVPLEDEFLTGSGKSRIKAKFDQMHHILYGHSAQAEAAQIINVRVTARGLIGSNNLAIKKNEVKMGSSLSGYRQVYLDRESGYVECPVYQRNRLVAGQELTGLAIIEEYSSNILVFPGDRVVVSDLGHLLIHVNQRRD